MTESFDQGDVLISSAASRILRIPSRFEVEDLVKQIPHRLSGKLELRRLDGGGDRIEPQRWITDQPSALAASRLWRARC